MREQSMRVIRPAERTSDRGSTSLVFLVIDAREGRTGWDPRVSACSTFTWKRLVMVVLCAVAASPLWVERWRGLPSVLTWSEALRGFGGVMLQ